MSTAQKSEQRFMDLEVIASRSEIQPGRKRPNGLILAMDSTRRLRRVRRQLFSSSPSRVPQNAPNSRGGTELLLPKPTLLLFGKYR